MTFAPGIFTRTVTLSTNNDDLAEGTENLLATLSAVDPRVTVSEPNATVFITDGGKCRAEISSYPA